MIDWLVSLFGSPPRPERNPDDGFVPPGCCIQCSRFGSWVSHGGGEQCSKTQVMERLLGMCNTPRQL